MFGKPYHPMPKSSWMVPGGNMVNKIALKKAQKYPVKSMIQKNLGGPLSDVFFSNLTPIQKDNIGYTPRLQGPGEDLWVSPSDILIGKNRITPRITTRTQKALTHQAIIELGGEIEARFHKAYELYLQEVLKKEQETMQLQLETCFEEALQKDRNEQYTIYCKIMEQSTMDTTKAYQETLDEAISQLQEEHRKRMEESAEKIKRQMAQELCTAVNSRSNYLSQQYEFQLAYRESSLKEKYENKIKKLQIECAKSMDKLQKQNIIHLKQVKAQLEAEHITDLLLQSCQERKKFDDEIDYLTSSLQTTLFNFFVNEALKKEFIGKLQDKIKKLKEVCKNKDITLSEVLRNFQKFINCALGETEGQAEYLLSLEKELKEDVIEDDSETDVSLLTIMSKENITSQVGDISGTLTPQQLQEHNKRDRSTIQNVHEKSRLTKTTIANLIVDDRAFSQDGSSGNKMISFTKLSKKYPSLDPILKRLHV